MLIAACENDQSDIMQDYHGATTTREVVLAFSKHQRNNFREFRKAALKSDDPGIRELATAPVDWEHRENYSMGGGYYLGQYRHSGWQISKSSIDEEKHLERFFEIAGKPGGFQVK